MPVTVIVGEQRGDEGKGRFVDMLMPDYDIGARFNGGDNAGHTVVTPEGDEFFLHGLPTSIVHEGPKSVIGNGAVVNPNNLVGEIATLGEQGVDISERNLLISGGAHLTLPHHILEDCVREDGQAAQGSTKSGIAQVYSDKAARLGIRAEIIKNDPQKLFEIAYSGLRAHRASTDTLTVSKAYDYELAREYASNAEQLGKYVTDTTLFLNRELRKDKPARVLAEGAQAALLDLDHGMYPFVTSSSTTSGGVATGLGVHGRFIDRVVGIIKAVPSHVGGGPFVTEIHNPEALESIHGDMDAIDAEKGTTTGRVRRLGHLDLPQIRRAQMINGTTEACITKADWLNRYHGEVRICVAYERKGKELEIAPDAAYKLEQSSPIYETLKTSGKDISEVRDFNDLPQEEKDIFEFIEDQTGVPISMIGVGPGRDQVIVRDTK